ncbi:DNA-dependent protein kinase catalytic subunit [Eufriesea mexicana]|uniref:DNA-dependent protein kinase catalytic subunit n=1 Tax=Eufriesea mexicana TaxID=516756 RepID=A0A310S8B0_9HYME|nr:DNA-dependent protein kinase catalytic subunit [Eufriesea mexicana]
MLSILFDKNKGLFSFLNNELNRSNPQKGFDMAIKEAFHLLEFIMEQFSDIFVLYVVEAKNVCQQALVTRCSSFIQKAASNTFNTLIQVFKEFEIELGETVKKFISLFHLVDIKERSLLLSVLGTIIKYFPEIFKVQEYSIIFQQLRNDFKKQYNPQTMAHSIDTFQVYLDVFSNILVELPKEVGEKHYEELYKWVKELSHPEKYSVKKVSMRSAINLLSKHMHLFCQFVYCDYKYWYDLLINLAQNKNVQCSECGKRALRNFYNEIGNILKHKTSEDDKAIFLYFKNLFEEQLKTNHHVNSSMLRFIIYGFSQMAAPCKRYLTNSDVKNMFSLIANCAMLLCSKDSLETIHLEIYNGIMWTCSHTLFIDAELQRELNNLPEQPRCYKSYLPLWLQLLNADRYGCHRQTAQDVVDSTIYVGIILIDKLNLSTRTKEDNIFSDASFSQIAENEADFRTFVNIVDLYVDMINHLQSSLFINTMHKFLLKIITISYKHHLISGFYKLVHATFRHICDLNNDEIEAETLELLYKYLMNALNLIPTFSNELLTTCLYLILNVPMIYVERILNSTIPIFKIAFTIGISDFELACTALNALEKWSNHLNNRHITVFLQEIVPFLEPYLHSRESSVEFLQDIIKTERKDIKRIILRDDENTLERFQMRILLFIASLDTSIIINFIYKRSMDTGATWDKKDLLKYSLVFSDTELEIYFDKILPRIILLAQNSGDRRTKIIACEVLHFIVAFVLGKTSQHLISNPDRFISVYVTLCPALLNLGCDHDEAARKIFQPLMLQLMHWLSSKFMLKSSVAMHFLDLLFNGLCNDSNPCLREFSGMCLAEFTKWSIKQSSDEAINQSNIYEVIYKMTNFAVHPSASKRIAGATAFNHLYTILREDEKIISIYWLEILYSFVRSLNGCSDPSIITALDHVERVLIAKKHVLNVKQHSRRKPYEFESSTLTDAVNWLLTQCGCLDQCCRTKCMKLVVKLSEHLADCNSIKIVINNYIETQGIEALNHIILSELPKIENLSVNHILPFLRSLDCYIWLIKDNLLNVEYLFGNSNSQREVIFNCARNFIHVINRIKIENKEGDLVILSKEFEDLQTLQCKTILTDNFIPDFFFNQDFFELIAKCIMCPQVLGFDVKNLEITEILPTVMENILQSIMSKNDNSLPDMINELIYQPEDKVKRIFKGLVKELGELIRINIKPSVKEYLEILMEFLLMHYEFSMTKTLIELIENNTMLGPDSKKIEHGIHFLNTFKCEIFKYMLKDTEKTIKILNDILQKNSSLFFMIIEQLFLFVQRHKKEFYNSIEILVDTVVKKFTTFENAINNVEDRKQKLINIFGIAVHLKHKPIELLSINKDFYIWILNQLMENSDIEYKIHILQNFLICLTDMTSDTKPELLAILRSLKNNRLDVCPNDFSQKNVKALKITNCFQKLIALLPVTKSVIVFESVISFAVGIAEYLCNEKTNEYLLKYFTSITTDYTVKSMQSVYRLFMNLNTQTNERFDVLYKFLLPSFEFCKTVEIHRFFEENIKEIHSVICQSLVGSSSDIKQLIISKIGCYNLIAIMFAKLDIRDIDDSRSVITRNAVDNVITGKELLQSLYSNALNIRMLKTPEPVLKETTRLLHCSAYNCSIAIVSNLKRDEDSYVSIFAENRKKEQLIWENIIDCQKQYNFQQTVAEYPKHRKKLINIRKTLKQKQASNHYSYIYSYDLSTCTLTEDINAYDFNETIVHNKCDNATQNESMSLIFEDDELNNHECMASICGVLNHLITEEISVMPTDNNITIPKWLKCFLSSITTTNYDNVRLFMLKVILNMQAVFQPYAKFCLQPIMHTTYLYLKRNQLNYIIVDVIELLINWQTSVFQNSNESTLRTILEVWHDYLKLPSNLDETMRTAAAAAMQRKFENRQMKCIRALCKNYPAAAITYFEFATANIFRVDAQGKSNCLEIFLLSIPNLSTDQILEELNHMKFYDLLKNKILPCEKVALKIIDSLVFILSPSNVLSLITLVQPYTKHELSEYREITYRIFINIYKKYMADNSEDNEIKQLMYISKEILVNGVLDPTITLQEMILNFWTQDAQLANTCKERLLEVLNIFTPSIGQNFLPFTFLLILDLSKKSRNYTQKLFEPLHDCSYRDYNIALSWRTKNLGSKAPLFAPSLTSQMNQMFTQMNTISPYISSNFTRSVYDSNAEIKLRVTQELEFEPTYGKETFIGTSNNLEQHNIFKIPKVPQPAYNKRSKRFLSSASDISAAIRQKEIKKNIQHAEMIKEEVVRQRSSVKLFRKYRIGDFPDIEISHATLIEPLQQLAKNDQIICKDLIVSIICSLIGDSRQSFIEQLTNNLKRIIENEQYNTSTVTAILEISLNTNIRNCSPETIVKISRSNGLHFLGSLVLEENIINETNISIPSKKKIRSEIIDNSSCKWLQLTNLYKTMNDIDIASFAQASSNWEKAKIAYEMACEMESELVKEHCFQGLFECLSNLCCWGEINTHIKNKLYKNLDNIWNDPWKDWLFPWVFEVHVRKLINEDISDEFSNDVKVMESWLEDNAKIKYVKRFFGEELSMFFLHNHLEVAREFLLNSLDEMREQWIKLHPLSMQLRIFKLQKLRTINDINLFIKILKSVQLPLSLDETLKIWNNNIPSTQDAILPWDKLISYRIYFIDSLLRNNYDEETSIIHRLHIITCNMKLKMIEASLNQKNKYIAKKYLRQLEQTIENYSTDLQNEFMFLCGKTKYLIGEIETDVKKKISNYISSWNYCHNLLQKDSLNDTINIDIRKEISKVALKIVSLSEEDEIFAELLRKNSMNLNELNLENNDLSIIRDTLENYSFNNLKACCDITTMNIGECYFNLAMYCYNRLTHGAIEAFISREFIHSILKAMSYGYLEAAHYFPCLLKPEYFNDQDTKDMFMKENESVETWLFLSWQAQLFSHLGTSIAPLIIPILKRIVDMYPNAVIYTFRLTVETNPALLNETSTYDIRQILYNKPEIDRFLIAMTYVVQPELYLQHYLTEFRKNLSLGTTTAVDILLKKVYPNALENKYDPKPGNIFNEIVVYKDKIKKLENKRIDEIKLRVDEIIKSIKESLEKRKNRSKLQYYSPWLCNFPERDIEIPGQYTGKRKPMPQYHAKILKFEPDVKVMQSLRKPIRITMIGNDAKDYHFLVKFGEDLRQDQRLQQLFTVMNKILHIDIACRQRQLSINTYQASVECLLDQATDLNILGRTFVGWEPWL